MYGNHGLKSNTLGEEPENNNEAIKSIQERVEVTGNFRRI